LLLLDPENNAIADMPYRSMTFHHPGNSVQFDLLNGFVDQKQQQMRPEPEPERGEMIRYSFDYNDQSN